MELLIFYASVYIACLGQFRRMLCWIFSPSLWLFFLLSEGITCQVVNDLDSPPPPPLNFWIIINISNFLEREIEDWTWIYRDYPPFCQCHVTRGCFYGLRKNELIPLSVVGSDCVGPTKKRKEISDKTNRHLSQDS